MKIKILSLTKKYRNCSYYISVFTIGEKYQRLKPRQKKYYKN